MEPQQLNQQIKDKQILLRRSQVSPAFAPFCSSFVAVFFFGLEWFADPVHKAKRLAFHSSKGTNTFHELFYTDLQKSQEPM